MGGNALKHTVTRRYDADEYFETIKRVISEMVFPTAIDSFRRINVLPAYRNKESFGDMDVLIETYPGDNIDWAKLIQESYQPNEIVRNSNCYSFNFRQLQVDFILTPCQEYETAYAYYSWNDLGNLMGRVAKKLGFKYGHVGLSYKVRRNNSIHSVFNEIVVSRNQRAIFEFLDYDYDRFLKGFDTLEDIFTFAASSKYFNKNIYLLENRNHVSRTRDKKRMVYNEFLKWCSVKEGLNEYPWPTFKETDGYLGDQEFVHQACKTFHGFAEERMKIEQELLFAERTREKFNGEIVKELLGISGIELGNWMKDFKSQYRDAIEMNADMMHKTESEIASMIRNHGK